MAHRQTATPRIASLREKEAKALEMRKVGATFQSIADALGYTHESAAAKAVKRALARVTNEPAQELIDMEFERLTEQYRHAYEVFARRHPVLYKGEPVSAVDPRSGQTVWLEDDGVRLTALREMRAIGESIRKLRGLDAATKFEVGGDPDGVPVEVRVSDLARALAAFQATPAVEEGDDVDS